MVFIGGFTRLTQSGLSMTDWHPITGWLPPLNNENWLREFAMYKTSPEYIKINFDITLREFQNIFWLEYIHRLFGRIIGLIFIIPLIIFRVLGIIKQRESKPYYGLILLFASQGVMGWLMVKSGLTDNPHVSHFRLGAHLCLAALLFISTLWMYLYNLFYFRKIKDIKIESERMKYALNFILTITFIQLFLGAMVAGLKAGLLYNNFPLMGDGWIPKEIIENFDPVNSFYDPTFIQFIHRYFAYVVIFSVSITAYFLAKKELYKEGMTLGIIVVLQFLLGVITLITHVNIVIALLHQIIAFALIGVIIYIKFIIENNGQEHYY